MPYTQFNENIAHFKQAINSMIQQIEQTEDALLYVKPSETEWSAMQIACHVVEAVHFWTTDLNALCIVPGAKWGRNHEHVRRLAAVADSVVTQVSANSIIEQLQALIPLTEQSLQQVQQQDLALVAPSYNPNFDGKPLSFLIEHLIVKHVVGHEGQLARHLEKVAAHRL